MENKLSDYENMMASLWPTISNGDIDFSNGTAIRKGIALFIALMYLRNPNKIASFKNIHSTLIKHYDKLPKDKNGNPLLSKLISKGKEYPMDTSDYKEYKNSSDIDFQHMFVESIEFDAVPIAEVLLKKRWAIVLSENDVFITSDNPVVVENTDRDIFGLNTKGTVITFPLSPNRVLIMDDLHDEGDGKYYPLRNNDPSNINLIIWRNAKEFMLSNRNPDVVCNEIVEYVDKYV